MSIVKQGIDAAAAKHIADGGSCRTVILSGVSVELCIDGNGDIIGLPPVPLKMPIGFRDIDLPNGLSQLVKLTGQ